MEKQATTLAEPAVERQGGSMRERIYEILREEILSCVLKPGEEFNEQELAARFSVSKSPVREALLPLQREGLVLVVPRQAYRVAPISITEAREMFQLRHVLEGACVAAAAHDATPELLASLDPYRTLPLTGGRDANFIDYNRRFHCALARASGNSRMADVACTLIEHMDRLVYISVEATKGRTQSPQQLIAEHGAIIDAVQARNAGRARRLVEGHIRKAEKRVLNSLEWAAIGP